MKFHKKENKKIFCLSMQRTGTTSVGAFFKRSGFRVAGWPISKKNEWSFSWQQGDFETIFQSKDFKHYQVFEDDPWWLPEFYKVLYHRFPNSKFILLTRNQDTWFESMLKHSNGKTLGNTRLHCKIYRRELDFFDLFPEQNDRLEYNNKKIDNLLNLKGYDKHYKEIYKIQNQDIKDFFTKYAPEAFFTCGLEDPQKWNKLAAFMNINIPDNFEVHENRSSN